MVDLRDSKSSVEWRVGSSHFQLGVVIIAIRKGFTTIHTRDEWV
jgi:hypothetical protein